MKGFMARKCFLGNFWKSDIDQGGVLEMIRVVNLVM